MAAPDVAVVTRLAGAGLGLVSGADLFAGPVRPAVGGVPQKAVFCLGTGGPLSQPYLGNRYDFRVKTVQVRIRSEPNAFEAGQTLARGCLKVLHRADLPGYIACLVREPEPTYIGVNDAGAHEWSLNCELWVKE